MANPQKEDGHVQLANEILEVLTRTPMPGMEMRMVLHVIRKTYGFGKKMDWISISQFAEALGTDAKNVCRVQKRLILWKILEKKDHQIGLNKNWEMWEVVARKPVAGTPEGSGGYASGVDPHQVVACTPDTKDNIQNTDNNTPLPPKESRKEKEKKRMVVLTESVERNKAIGEIIDAFKKTVNPEIDFGHKGHRNAAGRLVDAQGIEQAVAIAKYVTSPAYVSDQYAPTTTDPSALERNLPRIRVHALKKKNARGGIAIIS
jgi:phage replication O-like protein O